MKLTEAAIRDWIADYLTLDDWTVRRMEPVSDRKRGVGANEPGMADLQAIRYWNNKGLVPGTADVIWIEVKKPGGRYTDIQHDWHLSERFFGALTMKMGEDCDASVDGFVKWYESSGLQRKKVRLQGI